MKKMFALVTAVAFALSLAAVAVAQEKDTSQGTSSTDQMKTDQMQTDQTTSTTTKTTETKTAKAKKMTGTIESIDTAGGTFTVKPSKGESKTFKAGDKVKLDTLKEGEKVNVRYKGDTATSVKVAKGKKAASKKGASEGETKTKTTTETTTPSGGAPSGAPSGK